MFKLHFQARRTSTSLTIEGVFNDMDMPMSSTLKRRFFVCNIKSDNNKSFNNLVRMLTGSHKERAIKMLEDKVFQDEPAGDFL